MFEDEEWSINEDDLKDFNSDDIFHDNNDRAENLLLTKSVDRVKESVVLLNKTESNAFDNLENNVTFRPNDPVVSVSQKKVVLDIFKSNSLIHGNDKLCECSSKVTNEQGKSLIFNVFRENVEKSNPVVKSVLKISDHENKFKRKKNVAFVDCPGESNVAKKVCTESANIISRESRRHDKYIDPKNTLLVATTVSLTGVANNSKKHKLMDVEKSSIHKSIKVPRLKQAVIRQFPGPAGILPDDINENDVIDLDSLDENKNNKSNQYADICSQNTKKLFSTGAWQLMMDDLPADFELYDIATIKENALQYSKAYKKVPYLAGIVQYIDYKPNDPHIILKDLTGKVDARIHHSICKLYPNALGTSIVVLAKDVGLIVTSKKFVCAIISLNSLVSIYSDEARLVETPHLKTLFKSDGINQNLCESEIGVFDEIVNDEISHFRDIGNGPRQQSASILRDKCNVDKLQEINSKGISELNAVGQASDNHEFALNRDDSWLGVDIDELNCFKPHQFPSSTPMDSSEQNSTQGHFQIKKSKNLASEKIASGSKPPNLSNKQKISDKLSVFRNTSETPTPATISRQLGQTEKIAPTTSKPAFQAEGNDTDDEVLSQLDVDAITASYKTQNC